MESTSTSVRATVRWRREHAKPCTHTMPRTRHANAMQMPHTRRARATQAALATLRRAPCPAVSIVGNHELYNFDRAQLASASGEGANSTNYIAQDIAQPRYATDDQQRRGVIALPDGGNATTALGIRWDSDYLYVV